MGVFYVVAGVLHFVNPDFYLQIMPPMLPAPLALVYLSGVAEIVVGVGVVIPQTRHYAALATVALLVAIYPANIYMAVSGVVGSELVRWGRLPLQGVLVAWALWYTDSGERRSASGALSEGG
ncbi:DoxX family membrane protein [Halovenus sp. WSH3]|uniref:DoxX family membrane protein n=2 Tax=Halovenus carboxidivorans TaxID=2692199 RepID=A0A6B0SXR8_9EURY|nr:DoxX family membrane protein [Halovenus carboxidivorans]